MTAKVFFDYCAKCLAYRDIISSKPQSLDPEQLFAQKKVRSKGAASLLRSFEHQAYFSSFRVGSGSILEGEAVEARRELWKKNESRFPSKTELNRIQL